MCCHHSKRTVIICLDLLDPGIGDTWAVAPSANHRGCASRTPVHHAACPAMPGPGVGLQPLALTLLSGPCLAPLLFLYFLDSFS